MAVNLPSQAARGRRAPMAEINVTPLVDVMLVLLIIFMVTAPLMTAGVPVNLPDSRARPLANPAKPVRIAIDARGTVFVDEVEVSDATLPDALAQLVAKSGAEPPQVYLRADRELSYAKVVAVMGELSRAGLTKVALVTVAQGQ